MRDDRPGGSWTGMPGTVAESGTRCGRDDHRVADSASRPRDPVGPRLRRRRTGGFRTGARHLERGGANPEPLPRLARGRDRPPGTGSGLHRLRVDPPGPLRGGCCSPIRSGPLRARRSREPGIVASRRQPGGLPPPPSATAAWVCENDRLRFRVADLHKQRLGADIT